jgi:hypothetical protein
VGHQNSNGEEHQRFPEAEATLNSLVTSYQNHHPLLLAMVRLLEPVLIVFRSPSSL